MSEPLTAEELAAEIARHIFTAYSGTKNPVHCEQIWLYNGDREVAGWSERPMADLIAKHLKYAATRQAEDAGKLRRVQTMYDSLRMKIEAAYDKLLASGQITPEEDAAIRALIEGRETVTTDEVRKVLDT